ncbi:MAG: transposase [Anaerolineae bacterium]
MSSIELSVQSVKAQDVQALTALLNLPDFIVTGLERDDLRQQLVWFCEPAYPVAICPRCMQLATQIHEVLRRSVRDLAVCGYASYVEFHQRHFECEYCHRPFTETWESVGTHRRYTYRYQQYLYQQCHGRSIQDVSQQEGLDYHVVEALYLEGCADQAARCQSVTAVRCVGLDEIALRKGHQDFILVVSDLERHCVLTILPDRTRATLEAYFDTWPREVRQGVQ